VACKFPDYKTVSTDSFIPYARNSRTHSAEQVSKIAASIKEFGFLNPIIVDGENGIIAGHGRVLAAQKLGIDKLPCIEAKHLTDAQRRAYVIADNRLALDAGWDDELLRVEFDALKDDGFDLELTGFSLDEIDALQVEEVTEGLTDEDAVPEVPETPVSVRGDVWLLGRHRLMCGDSTSIDDVDKLMAGKKAALLHADPPYGMGKEGDGVANDNLYVEKLDAFQMDWWTAFRTVLEDNASAYIWGNAPDLWRLWYKGGLADSERLTLRNQIVWNKYDLSKSKPTVIEMMRSYCNYTEHCLFFAIGEQGFNNNADNYWEGWEPIRAYLDGERKKSGLTNEQLKNATSTSHTHYWTKSQWAFPTKENYEAIKKAANGKAFQREYEAFQRDYEELKRDYEELKRDFYSTRFYFDNTHENMTDVWNFSPVQGEERHGHATPKPVDMMVRVMRSSLPKDGLSVEPFGGSGATLIGAEKSGRICYTMELQEKYIDVIIKRWQDFTGKQATLESTGETYEELKQKRTVTDSVDA
jgi:DNA modification methylase